MILQMSSSGVGSGVANTIESELHHTRCSYWINGRQYGRLIKATRMESMVPNHLFSSYDFGINFEKLCGFRLISD